MSRCGSPPGPPLGRGAGADGARQASVIVGGWVLDNLADDGSAVDAPLVPLPRLAVVMGTTIDAARAAMRRAVAAGLVGQVGHRRGSAQAYRLLHAAEREADLAPYAALVTALADDDQTDLAVAAIRASCHPAVGYGLGRRAWMLLVADALELDPRTAWRWPAAAIRRARAAVQASGLDRAVDGPDLVARLTAAARRPTGPDGGTTPEVLAAEAEAVRRVKATARREAVLEVRAARDAARAERTEASRTARVAKARQATTPAPAPRTTPARRTLRLPADWVARGGDEGQLRAALARRGLEVVEVDAAAGTVVVGERGSAPS